MLNIVVPFDHPVDPSSGDRRAAIAELSRFLGKLSPSKRSRVTLVASEHALEATPLGRLASLIAPDCRIVSTPRQTGGPVFSTLLALDGSSHEDEIVVLEPTFPSWANLDEFLERSRRSGFEACIGVLEGIDAGIGCVVEDLSGPAHVSWNREGIGSRLCGFHWFRRCSAFIHASERAIGRHSWLATPLELGATWNEALLSGMRIGLTRIDGTFEPAAHSPMAKESSDHPMAGATRASTFPRGPKETIPPIAESPIGE